MAKKKRIKVAFPHMGTISIAWAAGLKKVGVEPYIPPYTSKKTLSYGTKNSPEAICLPYKLILGNFIEAIEGGADYVAMITSPGICRLGEYGNNIYSTLKDLGYKANYIELSLYDGIKGLYNFLKDISGKNDPILIFRAINITIRKIFAIDDLDKALSYYRAREIRVGDAEKAFKKGMKLIYEANHHSELKKAEKDANLTFTKITADTTIIAGGKTKNITIFALQNSADDTAFSLSGKFCHHFEENDSGTGAYSTLDEGPNISNRIEGSGPSLNVEGKALIVMPEVDAKVIKSANNIPGVKTTLVNTLNVYDILNYDKFIVVTDAVKKIEEVYA